MKRTIKCCVSILVSLTMTSGCAQLLLQSKRDETKATTPPISVEMSDQVEDQLDDLIDEFNLESENPTPEASEDDETASGTIVYYEPELTQLYEEAPFKWHIDPEWGTEREPDASTVSVYFYPHKEERTDKQHSMLLVQIFDMEQTFESETDRAALLDRYIEGLENSEGVHHFEGHEVQGEKGESQRAYTYLQKLDEGDIEAYGRTTMLGRYMVSVLSAKVGLEEDYSKLVDELVSQISELAGDTEAEMETQ